MWATSSHLRLLQPKFWPSAINIFPTACPSAGLVKLWHAERFPWHAAFAAVPIFVISFARPASPYCEVCVFVYTHTHTHTHTYTQYLTAYRGYMNYRCYQTTLQWNTFTQIGAVRSVDWIFTFGAPAWRWLGEYMILGKCFTIFYSNRK